MTRCHRIPPQLPSSWHSIVVIVTPVHIICITHLNSHSNVNFLVQVFSWPMLVSNQHKKHGFCAVAEFCYAMCSIVYHSYSGNIILSVIIYIVKIQLLYLHIVVITLRFIFHIKVSEWYHHKWAWIFTNRDSIFTV